ncbi:MAG: glycosyltransferase family 4 protein [Pseudomonadota bacterium]
MKILFIHQNFPGQYKHLSQVLAAQGHECVALTLRVKEVTTWNGVKLIPYGLADRKSQNTHPWVLDFDTKVTRAHACFSAARNLKEQGFSPDLILAHPGWGESMFLKDVWPDARMGIYCELYHLSDYPHTGFDPEFDRGDPEEFALRIRMKNLHNHLHFDIADAGISPTAFQADTFPDAFRDRITLCHDGINTKLSSPNPGVTLNLQKHGALSRDDEIITFVNRNLEPYRGYHIFMRALPRLLRERPNATVLIVGGNDVSYGARPPKGQTWKQIFIDEVRGQISDDDWDRVRFLDRIPHGQFTNLLQISRVHVYLTYPFVLSWSLLEAMSCGAAIVASDTEPVREVIRDGETGELVDFFDIDGIVERVSALLEDEDRRITLGQAARTQMVEHYDLRSICLPRQMDWVKNLAQL